MGGTRLSSSQQTERKEIANEIKVEAGERDIDRPRDERARNNGI